MDSRAQIKKEYNPNDQKQGNLSSSLGNQTYTLAQKPKWKAPDEYAEKQKAGGMTAKQKALSSSLGGVDATQFSNTPAPKSELLDLVIEKIPQKLDE